MVNMDVREVTKLIFEGSQVPGDLSQRLDSLVRRWADKVQDYEDRDVFERIRSVRGVFDKDAVQSVLREYTNLLDKNGGFSLHLRELGNEAYKRGDRKGALRAYTLALGFAVCGSTEELLALSNRSAVLLTSGCFKEARIDIEHSIKLIGILGSDAPQDLLQKLVERKSKCEGKTQVLNKIDSEVIERFFTLKRESEVLKNAEDFVEVRETPEKGRHLVVTRDVDPGTVLIVDKPYVSVVDNYLRFNTYHCTGCAVKLISPVSCRTCAFGFFCSVDCMDKSCRPSDADTRGGLHSLEHGYSGILHFLNPTHGEILSLRAMCVAPKSELNREYLERRSKSYDSSYASVYGLISHPPVSVDGESSQVLGIRSALRALALFETLRLSNKHLDEEVVPALLLHHTESFKFNSISVNKLVRVGDSQTSVSYAAAVYATVSLCNHSCDPSAAPLKLHNLTSSLVAMKRLPAYTEVTITYKPLYTSVGVRERRSFLAGSYRFVCGCVACENHWGPEVLSTGNPHVVINKQCCGACTEAKQCGGCRSKDLEKSQKLKDIETKLFELHECVVGEGKYDKMEVLKEVCEIISYFGVNGYESYFPLYTVALELFKRAMLQITSL